MWWGVVEACKGLTRIQTHHPWKHSNCKNPGTCKCRLDRSRKLLQKSRWWLSTDATIR
jgi:hypothetical protein